MIESGPDAGELNHIAINTEAKEKFIKQLKRSKLLKWKDSYVDLDICDGIQWSVRVTLEGEELYMHGSNKYPKKWDTFCMGVSELVDQDFQ